MLCAHIEEHCVSHRLSHTVLSTFAERGLTSSAVISACYSPLKTLNCIHLLTRLYYLHVCQSTGQYYLCIFVITYPSNQRYCYCVINGCVCGECKCVWGMWMGCVGVCVCVGVNIVTGEIINQRNLYKVRIIVWIYTRSHSLFCFTSSHGPKKTEFKMSCSKIIQGTLLLQTVYTKSYYTDFCYNEILNFGHVSWIHTHSNANVFRWPIENHVSWAWNNGDFAIFVFKRT